MAAKYKYYLRPGYGSENLLIEIFQGIKVDDASKFVAELSRTLKVINPVLTEIADLWMNDETMFCYTSNAGDFNLSIAIWDLGFITSQNQKLLKTIDLILQNNDSFEKIEVDHNDYKLLR